MRRNIIDYCRGLKLQTDKLRDVRRVFCHDISIQNANYLHALNGYLGITVRQYYVVKHLRKLKHSWNDERTSSASSVLFPNVSLKGGT